MKFLPGMLVLPILILSFFLRFYNLSGVPPSLNWDEVSHGYNAYSILRTGRDEWGEWLPLTNFRAYGDYPLPVSMYLMMPGIYLFGLNEFTVRLPSAFLGSLMGLIVYLLALQFLKRKWIALLAALLMSLSPWNLLTSRQAVQAIPAVFFLSLGCWLLIRGLSGKRLMAIAGTMSIGFSAYTYHNTRILAPLFLFLILYIYRKILWAQKKTLLVVIIISCLFFIPLVPVILSPEGRARANWVEILDQGAINEINSLRSTTNLPNPVPQLIYNKVTYFVWQAAANYIGYFSPGFLGVEGGTHYQFSVPHFGILYPIELPFFYLGLGLLLLNHSRLKSEKKILLYWVLVAPIPAAITRDAFQVLRSLVMMPVTYIVITLGFSFFLDFLKNRVVFQKIFVGTFVVLLTAFFIGYIYNLWFIYPKQYSFAWQYGYKEVSGYIKQSLDKYQKIVVTKKYGEPHEFLLFYLLYDPYLYQRDPNLVRYEKSNWFWVDKFSKFEFVNDWEIQDRLAGQRNLLLITSPQNYPSGARMLKTVDFLDGKKAFDIVAID